MASDSKRDRLPFEPRRKKDKPEKKAASPPETPESNAKAEASLSAIPEAVSRRMVKRMAIFCGIPSALGLSSFFIFYWVVSHDWLEIPTQFVFAATLGLFGLGVVGLSYGILSASWEEYRPGGWLGFQEFRINAGRLIQSFKAARQEAKQAKNN